MTTNLTGDGALFDLPPEEREPQARVILVTGPSGSGKTRFTGRTGLPVVALDDFYYDDTHPGLPRKHGIIDWDSPACWDRQGALGALIKLATTGEATLPIYDIPTNSKVAERTLDLEGSPLFLAEGIFAAELVHLCRREGILADAFCISRPRLQTFWFRLMRDLDEGRKPPIPLIRRGISHMIHEPEMYRDLERKGARRVSIVEAHEALTQMLAKVRR
ncbi:ATP-binding protein [Flaviflexus ciconiae]|uniref:ATP-binding protein n=1 Tax=Flaviflexus ciconiae TaxID=2496867 RepID=A0A3Q9G755_9ACTO|nr:ATP-binding protein [Flaviflexus ciconiae]AZQ77213.1 ATP-binding protein [Flaviflexus ciconiae]